MIVTPHGYGLGCRPDQAHKKTQADARLHPKIAAALKTGMPSSFSLAQFELSQRLDQGQSGSCTWGSSTGATVCAFAAQGQPLGYVPSQRVGYGVTLAFERGLAWLVGQPLPPLQDVGAEIADVETVYGRYGTVPMLVQRTPDGRFYDLWTDADTSGNPPGNVTDEPNLLKLEEAGEKLVTGAYRVDPAAPDAAELVAAAIANGIPIEMGFLCDSTFQGLGPNDVAPAPDTNDPTAGGHAVYLAGYRTNAAGAVEFRLTNSWGDAWCDAGRCWVSAAWLAAAWDLRPWDVAKKGTP